MFISERIIFFAGFIWDSSDYFNENDLPQQQQQKKRTSLFTHKHTLMRTHAHAPVFMARVHGENKKNTTSKLKNKQIKRVNDVQIEYDRASKFPFRLNTALIIKKKKIQHKTKKTPEKNYKRIHLQLYNYNS